jgi:hypothetical protein
MSVVYDPNAKRAVISFEDAGDSQKGKFVVAKYNGATSAFTFDTVTEFNSGATDFLNSVLNPDENVVVTAYVGAATNYPGQAVVIRAASTSTNNSGFIGIANEAIADGASGKTIVKGGIASNATGLTPGTTYYIDYDGSLTATSSENTVGGGTALSSTSILLNG